MRSASSGRRSRSSAYESAAEIARPERSRISYLGPSDPAMIRIVYSSPRRRPSSVASIESEVVVGAADELAGCPRLVINTNAVVSPAVANKRKWRGGRSSMRRVVSASIRFNRGRDPASRSIAPGPIVGDDVNATIGPFPTPSSSQVRTPGFHPGNRGSNPLGVAFPPAGHFSGRSFFWDSMAVAAMRAIRRAGQSTGPEDHASSVRTLAQEGGPSMRIRSRQVDSDSRHA